ncbi:MAG: tetraacyldisaccharide 4'-kinase [Flavobacterium psychrophilum]|nr:MAG: tetraacyldisaccharide 4'-kinase [Flavobacterium psychrophilum]
MKLLRKLLFPFSSIYFLVTAVRNVLYDRGVFKSYTFPIPVIAVGNLSTGGTGKSPQTEYLIRLLTDKYNVATLSRGYKRKSEGFVLADKNSNAEILGDEPYQFYSKFPSVQVAVDANRKNGIEQLLSFSPQPEIILLDDAYQHRRVKAGFYILLTSFGDLYTDDYILPTGNLRESRSGANRADVIVVTKCPQDLSEEMMGKIVKKLKPNKSQKVYFTCIEYDNTVYSENSHIDVNKIKGTDKVLVAGIAKPKPFFEYLKNGQDELMEFPDHHDFTDKELADLNEKAKHKLIITTEKDFMRLKGKLPSDRLYYLPIKSRFLKNSNDFDNTILDYVGKSTANS